MSTLEITSSGVPLIVSDLLGVRETVIPNETGFTPGDFVMLAERIMQICDDDELRMKLGQGARKRVESFFKREMQIENLTQLIAKESGSIFMGLETNIRSGANVCAP
jgi:glycosyltransferase involved in cell wall biosynthesis